MTKDKFSFSIDGVKYTDIKGSDDSRNDRFYIGVAGTAQMINQFIKKKYPSLPARNYYWVRSSSFANGNAIDIYFNDAPEEFYNELKKELERKFEYGSYHYGSRQGGEELKNKTDEGKRIDYGTKYLHVNNRKPYDSDAPSVDWESLLSQKSAPSAPARTNPSGQRPSYPMGEVLKDCAGWIITKKTLPDGRIVYNAKIKPDTPKNKGDWNEIKGEIYVQTGFKWGRFGAFEKWGVIASEAAVVEILCQILGKYYQGGNAPASVPAETPAPSPSPNNVSYKVGDKFKDGNDTEIPPKYIYTILQITESEVEVSVYYKQYGTTDTPPPFKKDYWEQELRDSVIVPYLETPSIPQPEAEKNVGLYVNGEFIENVVSQEEAFKILQDNFGATKLQEMIDNNQAYFNMSKNRVDLIRDSYVYGKKWGVPTKYGNELQFAFIDKGYKVYVSAKQNLLVVYKTEMAKDGVIIYDNGGEFTLDRYGYNENIGSINYVAYDEPVSVVTLAFNIDDIATAFFNNQQQEEAPATTGTRSKEDIAKAIKGLQYLADKGNEKAIKAIKGLQYLLNK
jgi:hypothetical protein